MMTLLTVWFALFLTHDPPQAHSDKATVFEGQSVMVDVLANDSDPDGQWLAVTVLTQSLPAGAQASVTEDGAIVFSPAAGFAGQTSFQYRISDGTYNDTATVDVTVLPSGPHARLFAQEFAYRAPIGRQALFEGMPSSSTGQRVSKRFVIRNDGTSPMTFTGIIGVQSPSGAFTLHLPSAPPKGTVLQPSSEATFRIFFQPQSLGLHAATITLPVDDPAGPFVFDMQAEALPANQLGGIRVEQDGVFIGNGDSFNSIGGPSYRFDIINPGLQALELADLQPPPGYSVTQWFPESVQPGETVSFEIKLDGASYPPVAGTMQFKTNLAGMETFEMTENHWPIAGNDLRTLAVNETIFINLVANDSDPDGDQPVLAPIPDLFPNLTQDGSGFITSQGGRVFRTDDRLVEYRAPNGFSGQDQFLYRIDDGRGRHTLGQVILDIGGGTIQPTSMEIVAQDGFSNTGIPLHQAPVGFHREAGSNWTASPDLLIDPAGHVTSTALGEETHLKAYMPFFPWLYSGEVFEIQAEVRLQGTKWAALAFTHGSGGVFGSQAGLVFVLNAQGAGTLFASQLQPLAFCDPASHGYTVTPASFNQLKLRFDTADRSVSVWINGQKALNRIPFNDPMATSPLEDGITNAGFYSVTQSAGLAAGDFGIDNVTVRQGNVHQAELQVSHQGIPLQSGQVLPLTVNLGQTGDLSISIANAGNEPLAISGFDLDGGPAWSLLMPANPNASIPPGNSLTYQFRLDSDAFGAHPATVTFATNDPGHSQFQLNLDGQVDVTANSAFQVRRDGAAGPIVTWGETLTYPETYQGRLGVLCRILIDNISSQTLNLTAANAPGGQWDPVGTTPISLTPGARGFLEFRAQTDTLGLKTSHITITADQPVLPLEFTLETTVVPSPPAPEAVFQTANQRVWEGEDAVFQVEVEGGTPPYSFDWHFDGGCCQLITCSLIDCNLPHISGAGSNTLTIHNVSQADLGRYNVYIEDSAGQVVITPGASLDLKEPRLTQAPVDRYGDGSGQVQFELAAEAPPGVPLTYAWTKDSIAIDPNDPTFTGADTSTLAFWPTSSNFDGLYNCIVTAGQATTGGAANFRFLQNPNQILDHFDSGLPASPVLPFIPQFQPLNGREPAFGSASWNATDHLVYAQSVRISEGLVGAASIPFTTSGSRISEVELDLSGSNQGYQFQLAFLNQDHWPWPPDQPLTITLAEDGDQVAVTISRAGMTDIQFPTDQYMSNLNQLLVTYHPGQRTLNYVIGNFSGVLSLEQPLNSSHIGFAMTLQAPSTNSPSVRAFRAEHLEIPIAHDDYFDVAFDHFETVQFNPLANDEGTALEILSAGDPSFGTVTAVGTQSLLYQPPQGFTGTATFQYTVRNRDGQTATATIAIDCREEANQNLALTDGLFQTTVDVPVSFDGTTLVWSYQAQPFEIVSLGFPVQPILGHAEIDGEGQITYHPNPGASGRDEFSFEVRQGSEIRTGSIAILIRNQTGGHYWDSFTRDPGLNGTPLTHAGLESGNGNWSTGFYLQTPNDLIQPMTFLDGSVNFAISENMLALLPYQHDVQTGTVIAAEVDLSDPSIESAVVLGLGQHGHTYFPTHDNSQAIWLTLSRDLLVFEIRGTSHSQQVIPFDPALLAQPLDLRLHLKADGGIGVYLNEHRVWEAEDRLPYPSFLEKLAWAGFGLKAASGGGLPTVDRFDLFEHSTIGVPDPVLDHPFETSPGAFDNVSGSVSITANSLFGGGSLAAIHDGAPAYVENEFAYARTRLQSRFYLDTSGLTMADGDWHVIHFHIDATAQVRARVELTKTSQGHMVRGRALDSNGQWVVGAWAGLEPGPNLIELDYQPSQFNVTVNQSHTSTAMAVAPGPVAAVRLGAISGLDASTTGTALFDAWTMRKYFAAGPEPLIRDGFTHLENRWQTTDPAAVTITPQAAASGLYGVRVDYQPTGIADLLTFLDRPEPDLAGSFQFHPNSIAMAGNSHDIFVVNDENGQTLFKIQLRQDSNLDYSLRTLTRNAQGSLEPGDWVAIGNQFNLVGWHWRNGADGFATLQIGAGPPTTQTVSGPSGMAKIVRFGSVSSLDATTSGSVFFDSMTITKFGIPQQ